MTKDALPSHPARGDTRDAPQVSPFKKATLDSFPDIGLFGCNAFELFSRFGDAAGMEYKSSGGNTIVIKPPLYFDALKNTTLFVRGKNNTIVLDAVRSVYKLEIACTNGSSASIKSPETVRGLTIFCSHRSRVDVGAGCMIARDVLVYASRAHGLYSVVDGTRRSKDGVAIGDRVWLGQGARILGGARIGDGSVIGSYSVLAGTVPNNCAAAGNPCRVTTKDIFWSSRAVAEDGNYFEMLAESGRPLPAFIRRTEDSSR